MKLVLMELSFLMLAIFVLVEGQSETSVTVPYIKPMLIGRTFDLSKSTIGGDIFEQDTIQLKTTQNFLTTSKFKIVKTKQQVRDVLDVSGQLSLQIMSGAVNIKGEGKYLKETSSSSNFVEVLAKITFQTITESIINKPTLQSGWKTNPIGQHYVRGITYGGYLIASLKFEAKNTKDKENVEAKVSANVKAGTGNVAIEGQFKKLAESVNDISTLSISYVATAPLKNVPTDIDSLIKAITDFPELVKSTTTGGRGVPIDAHLFPLSELDVKNDKLRFLIDSTTQTSLDELNSKYFDLITTTNAIKRFTSKYPLLTDEAETNLGKFYDRVFAIVVVFNQVIGNLDLRKAGSQFNKAYAAYREGTTGLTGKFKREFDKLILNKKGMILFSPIPEAYKKNGVLYLKANNSYTAIAQASKLKQRNTEFEKSLGELKSQLKSVKQSVSDINHRGKSCASLYKSGKRKNGLYTIDPDGLGPFQVSCDMTTDGGGWTVFQRRQDGSEDFCRGWSDYKAGFGDLNKEFWLGLDKIHCLTKSDQDVLRIDLMDFENEKAYAKYGTFAVASESEGFKLSVGSFSGTARDSLSYHNGMKITTKDKDNDRWDGGNCAAGCDGAWWFNSCDRSNLNGLYPKSGSRSSSGIRWYYWENDNRSMKKVEMKTRPAQF